MLRRKNPLLCCADRSRTSIFLLPILFSVAFSIAVVPRGFANLVTNGDFETGNLTDWTWTADAGSEPQMAPTVVAFNGSSAFRVNPGNDFGEGGPEKGGTLSQPISVELGTTYLVAIQMLAIQDVNSFDGNRDGGTITVSLEDSILHTLDVEELEQAEIVTDSFTVPFEATTTGDVQLEIYFSRQFRNFLPNVFHYLDDVSIIALNPGDMNGDGVVDQFDVNPFVKALTDPVAYEQEFPYLPIQHVGDVSGDGFFDLGDVSHFITLLSPGVSKVSEAPEPSTTLHILLASAWMLIRRRRKQSRWRAICPPAPGGG